MTKKPFCSGRGRTRARQRTRAALSDGGRLALRPAPQRGRPGEAAQGKLSGSARLTRARALTRKGGQAQRVGGVGVEQRVEAAAAHPCAPRGTLLDGCADRPRPSGGCGAVRCAGSRTRAVRATPAGGGALCRVGRARANKPPPL
eukprot:scaffold650_cov407-Prasinococcus_capsulatus_cf.AAC.39